MSRPNDDHERSDGRSDGFADGDGDDGGHEGGFHHDLPRMIPRRWALLGLAGIGGLAAAGGLTALTPGRAAAADGTGCVADPPETAGPFPGDGTNSKSGRIVNVLAESGVVRRDLRPSFAGMTPVAEGLELTMKLRLVNARDGCRPLPGRALYIWHCDAPGRYSIYNDPDRNYLRGVGVADADGVVRFTTIFPGCYRGRWPHFHFEAFSSLDAIATGRDSFLTSQLALPQAECAAVYAADARYEGGTRALSRLSLGRDVVFADSTPAEMNQRTLSLSGSPRTGFAGRAVIGLLV
ncbi:MAG: intradiol ring-cleavage dioxygenase [Pseudomonadota bacterium]